MERQVETTINEIEQFITNYQQINETFNHMIAFLKVTETEEFKTLDEIYNLLVNQGITKRTFVDILLDKINKGELTLPSYYKNVCTQNKLVSFVNNYFVNLKKYNDLSTMLVKEYQKESDELTELLDSKSKDDEENPQKGILRRLFKKRKKEQHDSTKHNIDQEIAEKRKSLENAKLLYDNNQDIVNFLLKLQRTYPKYITLLSIENQLLNLFSEKEIYNSFFWGYEVFKDTPKMSIKNITEIASKLSIPKGTILSKFSQLQSYVNEFYRICESLDIEITENQLTNYDEYCNDSEFLDRISYIINQNTSKKK